MTVFVYNMTVFFLNMTGFVPNMTGFFTVGSGPASPEELAARC